MNSTGEQTGRIGAVSAVQTTFAGYLEANQRGIGRDVVEFVDIPLTVSTSAATTVLGSAEEVEAFFDVIARRLASLSYVRTDVRRQEVEIVNGRTAVVQISGDRIDTYGRVIEPIAAFYIFNLVGRNWRLSVLAPSLSPDSEPAA